MSVERWVNLVIALVMAGLFFYLGARGLLGRRSLVYSARWIPGIYGLFFLRQLTPMLGGSMLGGSEAQPGYGEVASPSVVVMLSVVLLMFWVYANGYIVFGASEQALRSALHRVLDARGLAREDRPGAIHLPGVQLDLQLQRNEWAGTATVKVAPARGKPLLRELGGELQRVLASQPIALRENLFVVYTYLAAILAGIAALYLR